MFYTILHRHIDEVHHVRTYLRERAKNKWFEVQLSKSNFQRSPGSLCRPKVGHVLDVKLFDVLVSNLVLEFSHCRNSLIVALHGWSSIVYCPAVDNLGFCELIDAR